MIESRCGICCSQLNCKEKYGFDCKGCANEASAPWGECAVKICCEGKGLLHCGECEQFPCKTLNEYAYDPKEGDNGARLTKCKEWCKNKYE